jgi:CheY-like chemotaxis protein
MPDSDAPRQFQSSLLILLIDDDAISREVLQMMLEIHGFAVESAEDGPEALAWLTDAASQDPAIRPDTILMDTQMPGLSGLQLIKALRGRTEARIIAISGSDPGEMIRQAADGFLLKPIQPEDVVALLGAPGKSSIAVEAVATRSDAGDLGDLIDPVVLGKLKAMMPASAVREIYTAVASDLAMRLITLQAAMNASNAAEVARIAHAIKGGCAMVGLTSARDAAARLETSNLPVTWPEELSQLRIAMSGLEGMLGSEFPA